MLPSSALFTVASFPFHTLKQVLFYLGHCRLA